jgi:hypothetical protein
LDITSPIGRREVCVFCGSDLHCCLNCSLYKIDSYNDCREPQAERVIEKSLNNFCEYFDIGSAQQGNQQKEDGKIDAKMKLELLFKKD